MREYLRRLRKTCSADILGVRSIPIPNRDCIAGILVGRVWHPQRFMPQLVKTLVITRIFLCEGLARLEVLGPKPRRVWPVYSNARARNTANPVGGDLCTWQDS